ncbi:Uncharacterized protein LARI1_G003465 [Lachnellula arida]|uniref:Uncharacterized protein n=1 Tax=Lachnellula arida TaxID=1316785 RepID=A0A8T9BCD7_9HELO|nr:Uncharacterized protein LARI1_G003465 [Lachnellula arida]
MVTPRVLIPMSDYGHDPTGAINSSLSMLSPIINAHPYAETAVPYAAFKKAGFEVEFATENGQAPECDKKMLKGITQKLLGASKDAINAYKQMCTTPSFQHPLSWTSMDFSLQSYNLVFLPGGHEKGVRQLIDSPCVTTALPARFEQVAFWGTRAFLGDYYKTYGAGSENVEESVRKRLDDPDKQYKNSLGMSPFVVQDEKYNYISARFPADAQLLAEKTIALVQSSMT